MNYSAYINGAEWEVRRQTFVLEAGGRCQFCGAERAPSDPDAPALVEGKRYCGELHVHHLHYRTLGNEGPADVIVLCKRCHGQTHAQEAFGMSPEKRCFHGGSGPVRLGDPLAWCMTGSVSQCKKVAAGATA